MQIAPIYDRIFAQSHTFLRRHALLLMVIIAGLFIVFVSTLAVLNHLGLRTQLHDLGHMQQSLWQLTQGRWSMPLTDPYPPNPRFYVHANVVFYLLAPLYALIPSAITLSLLQVLSVGLAGLGIFLLARKLTKNPILALLFGVAFLANPMVQDATIFDFHPEVMAYALVAFLFLCIEKKRWGWYWVLLLLLLTLKEDMPPLAILLGFFVMKRASLKQGILTSVVAGAYLVTIYTLTSLLLDVSIGTHIANRFVHLGNTPLQITWRVVSDPLVVFSAISQQRIILYTLYLLAQGSFLALASPLALLPMLPTYAINILELLGIQAVISGTYHSGILTTLLCIASIYGYVRLAKWNHAIASSLLLLYGFQALVFTILLSPLPYGTFSSFKEYAIFHDRSAFERISSLIPPEAALATQNNLGPHFMHREKIYEYPNALNDTEYILLAIFDPTSEERSPFRPNSMMLLSDINNPLTLTKKARLAFTFKDFGILDYSPPFYLFKRGQPQTLNNEAFRMAEKDITRLERRHALQGLILQR